MQEQGEESGRDPHSHLLLGVHSGLSAYRHDSFTLTTSLEVGPTITPLDMVKLRPREGRELREATQLVSTDGQLLVQSNYLLGTSAGGAAGFPVTLGWGRGYFKISLLYQVQSDPFAWVRF